MRTGRLNRREPTWSTAVQRPGRIDRGSVVRIEFVPLTQRLRADARVFRLRTSESFATAARLMRARARSERLPLLPWTEILTPVTRSAAGGGGGEGGGGGGGCGGGFVLTITWPVIWCVGTVQR